jgi:hypothetical protein
VHGDYRRACGLSTLSAWRTVTDKGFSAVRHIKLRGAIFIVDRRDKSEVVLLEFIESLNSCRMDVLKIKNHLFTGARFSEFYNLMLSINDSWI